jgi:hypothetical protein
VASLCSYFFSFRFYDLNALDLVAASDSIDYVHAFDHLSEDRVAAIEPVSLIVELAAVTNSDNGYFPGRIVYFVTDAPIAYANAP